MITETSNWKIQRRKITPEPFQKKRKVRQQSK